MLFLSDDVNPGERRRRKSAVPANGEKDPMAGSARRKASLENASLLVPSAARRRSMNPMAVQSVSPANQTIDTAPDVPALSQSLGSSSGVPDARGNSNRRMSMVRRASFASGGSRNSAAASAASPSPGLRPLQVGQRPGDAPRRRRSVSFSKNGENGDDADADDAASVGHSKSQDIAPLDSDQEMENAGPRDIVVAINVGSNFHAFAEPDDNGQLIGEEVVSQGSTPPLSPRPARSPRRRMSSDANRVHLSGNSSFNGTSDDADGDEDRVEYAADEIPSSLFIFSGTNCFRVFCLTVIQNWLFHQVILACIVANSVTLAMDQPAVDNPAGLDTFLTVSEYIFTAVFFIECVLKVTALGFVAHRHSYLRTPWNVLDFIIVCASIVSLFTTSSNVSALRVVRVLRPLRSVSRIKNLRMLIAGLFQALPEVVNNLLLFAFLTLVFAVAAVQLWSATLSQRCYVSEFEAGAASQPRYANLSVPFLARDDPDPCGGNHVCPSTYGNDSKMTCAIHRDIYRRRNLNYDNFFSASLLVFKVMVFDNWPDDLNDAMNAIGPTSIVFFVMLTLIGGYVCVNLFLAVLTQGYSKAAHQIQNEEELELVDTEAQTDFASPTELSSEEKSQLNVLMLAAEVKRKKDEKKARKAAAAAAAGKSETSAASFRVMHGGARQAGGTSGSNGSRSQSMSPQSSPHGSTRLSRKSASANNSIRFVATGEEGSASLAHGASSSKQTTSESLRSKASPTVSPRNGGGGGGNSIKAATLEEDEGFGTQVEMTEAELQHIAAGDAVGGERKRERLPRGGSEADIVTNNDTNDTGDHDMPALISPMDSTGKLLSDGSLADDIDDAHGDGQQQHPQHQHIPDWDDDDFDFDDEEYEYNPADPRCAARQLVGWVIVHRFTEIFMMLVTLLNVVVLAIDHYGIDSELAFQLDVISLVCTVIFTIEITVKVFAFGFPCLKSGFNALDFLLVVIALVTIAVFGWQAGGSISAFRALRVFRVFRLLSKFESLQTVIDGIMQSVASIGYLSFLILLFLYVWSIMGMQVFGTDYGSEDAEVRDSFGTIWQSAILTFIVVTGDNWTDKMQVGMSSYSNGLEIIPVVYFISLYMIGNFILINLSVAIIVDKLQEKMDAFEAKQNAEEHPPILLIAPFAVGQMAYRDAIEEELKNFNSTSSGLMMSQTMGAKSFRMKSFRRPAEAPGVRSAASDTMIPEPTLSQVIAPRTDTERREVEVALERYNNQGRRQSHSIKISPTSTAPASPAGEQPVPAAPFARRGSIAQSPKSSSQSPAGGPPAIDPSVDDEADALAGTANADSPVFTETINANLAMKMALQQQDEQDAAEATAMGHDAAGAGVPLTEARYVDDLAEDHASATTQCRLFSLYLVSFTVSKPPVVDNESKSLFLFAPDHPVRRACLYIVGLPLYNGFILLCIIANVVFLTLDGPGASDATLLSILISDYVFAVIFFVEMVIKIIALGGWIENVAAADAGAEEEADEAGADEEAAAMCGEAAVADGRGDAEAHDSGTGAAANGVGQPSNSIDALSVASGDADEPPPMRGSQPVLVASSPAQVGDDDDGLERLSAQVQARFGSGEQRPMASDDATSDVGPAAAASAKAASANNAFLNRRKKRPYFRDAWNCIDSFVTLISIVGLFVPLLKALRALRTIRLVARIETTRIILVALVQAVPHVMHGLLLSLVVYLVFGILGVQLFKGRLYRCNDPDVELKALCNGTWINQVPGVVFDNPIPTPREWVRTTYHFDHLGAALMTLFVVSIGDGWSDIMFDGMDIVDDEHALKRNNAPWMSLYFIMVFIACNFFAINMMIGILINYFSKKKQEEDGSAFLTPKQQQYVKARDIIADNTVGEESVRTLDNDVSVKISEVITYRHPSVQRISIFDLVMLVFIIVNVVAVAAEHDDMDEGLARSLFFVQLVCLIVFTLEMLFKWAAYGPWYFTTNWNRFDFVIVVVGWISVGLPAVKFLAFLRVFRVIKLIRDTGVEKLIFMLIRSISSLLHVVTILLLTYFIFAVAGVALFGNVKFNGPINENNNFRTVWSAMLLLYQSATTENWNGVMEAVSVQPPACDPGRDECGNEAVGTTYFILFMVCCTFVALQLFVAIIVEIFDGDADNSDPIRNAFAEMRSIWIEQFGDETPRVHYTELVEIMPFFPPILTDFPDDETVSRADMIRLLASLPIPIDSKHRVRYTDVINALAFKKYQVDPRTMGSLVEDAMGSLFVGSAFSMAQVYALDVIADLWMEYKGDTLKHCISESRAKRQTSMPSLNGSRKSNAKQGEAVNFEDSFSPATNPEQRDPAVVDARRRASIGPARPSTAAVAIDVTAADPIVTSNDGSRNGSVASTIPLDSSGARQSQHASAAASATGPTDADDDAPPPLPPPSS